MGDWVGLVALWRVGDDENGHIVSLLEVKDFHHEKACDIAFLGTVAEVCEVVDNDDARTEIEGSGFNVADD